MDVAKVGVGTILLATSGLTMQVAGQSGASVPIVFAGAATVGLAAALVRGGDRRLRP